MPAPGALAASEREECRLPTYGELAEVLDSLPLLIRERRRRERLSVRGAARQSGCSAMTLSRWERADMGRSVALLQAVLRWLDEPAHVTDPVPECQHDSGPNPGQVPSPHYQTD